jgi:aminotransferase
MKVHRAAQNLSANAAKDDPATPDLRRISVECERLGGINLAQGICDTGLPRVLRDALISAVDKGFNTYVRLDGIAPLRRAIARKAKRINGLHVDADRHVLVTAGATGGLFSSFWVLISPGEEVIVFDPSYSYYAHLLRRVGAVPKFVNLKEESFALVPERLTSALTKKTSAIILNSPANPSGKVFTREELEFIASIARRNSLIVFTDEIYEHFLYDGRKHISIATLPGMWERTVTVSGYSKTFAITGWRIGYVLCREDWVRRIGYVHDLAYVCAPAPMQWAVADAINILPSSYYTELARSYERKRSMLIESLHRTGLKPVCPEGSYYIMADASALPGRTGWERAMYLLRRSKVATVPGSAFYHDESGACLLRFCFAKTDSVLSEACHKLERAAGRQQR